MPSNGGPAYPQHGWSSDPETIKRMQGREGMSLRDYFAAAAMQGMTPKLHKSDAWNDLGQFDCVTENACETLAACELIANTAYTLADAMIRERERKTS